MHQPAAAKPMRVTPLSGHEQEGVAGGARACEAGASSAESIRGPKCGTARPDTKHACYRPVLEVFLTTNYAATSRTLRVI
jgi:hypothetical protein